MRPSGACRMRLAAAAACLLVAALSPAALAAPAEAAGTDVEAAVMIALRELAQSQVPAALLQGWSGWLPSDAMHHCDAWAHVWCDDRRRVVRLHLSGPAPDAVAAAGANGSAAAVPVLAQLARLQHLRELVLRWPGLSLDVPVPLPEWTAPGTWPKLQRLEVFTRGGVAASVALPGIPEGSLPALHHLELDLFHWRSTLPSSWGSPRVLPALRTLTLQLNVQGGLPAEWVHGFAALESLAVVGSRRAVHPPLHTPAGTSTTSPLLPVAAPPPLPPPRALPAGWAGGFPRLQSLVLSELSLTGPLPEGWMRPKAFPALHFLHLDGNALTGTLPPQLFTALPQLEELHLAYNSFTGSLPPEWAGAQVGNLDLFGNPGLSGPAIPPAWLARPLPRLKSLLLSGNHQLTGTLPPALPSQLSSLIDLALEGTGVVGSIPAAWCAALAGGAPLSNLFIEHTAVDPSLPPCMPPDKLVNLGGASGQPGSFWMDVSRGMEGAPLGAAPRAETAATLALAIALPVCAVAAAGIAGRLVLRRRRRQQLRTDLEQQSLLRRQQQGRGSSAAASSGAARRARPPRPTSLVRPMEAEMLAALLHSSLAAGSVAVMPLQAASEGLAHQLGAAGSGFGGAASLELCARLPAASPADKVQAWMARGTAALPAGSVVAGAPAAAGAAAAAAAAVAGSRRPLPAAPPSSQDADSAGHTSPSTIEFVRDARGQPVQLGSGSCAGVFLARQRPDGREVAAKVYVLEAGVDSSAIGQEAALLRQCEHPRIVPLLGVALKSNLLLLVMERVRGGSLASALRSADARQQLRWAARGCQLALDLAEAVNHLHTRLRTMHGDLKPSNVLLTEGARACLSDLGLAQMLGVDARMASGCSRIYAAPEQLAGQQRCTMAADIYSFGLVLVALLTQQVPQQRDEWRLPRAPQECPQEVAALVESCLAVDPRKRPAAGAVLARLRAAAERQEGGG